MTNFDTMEKELREKRGVISNIDFAREVAAIVTVAIDAMINTRNKEFATTIATMKTSEALSKLFPEEPQDEKEDKAAEEPQEEKNTEKDLKFEDLKNLLFNHASGSSETIPGTDIENSRTAEMRRSAKHAALISLILNAGLGGEYREWLRKKYE